MAIVPMDTQLVVICRWTFVIRCVGTLAYSVRIAGVRTRRIALSSARARSSRKFFWFRRRR